MLHGGKFCSKWEQYFVSVYHIEWVLDWMIGFIGVSSTITLPITITYRISQSVTA
jgi:hypothetical protein